MGVRFDRGYLDALRHFGLRPVEVAGCWTSGRDFTAIKGSLDHHTAGARSGYWPSARILLEGRSDLPPRLCNTSTPRAGDGDMTVYFCAAGKANHAGTGRLPVDHSADSNYELAGLERELVGDGSDLTPHRHDVACRVHAATLSWAGLTDVRRVVRHATYALPAGRKIDTRGVTDAALQDRVRILLTYGTFPPSPQEINDMEATFVRELHEIYLGADPVPKNWNNGLRASFNHWLWVLLSGQMNREQVRQQFQKAAQDAGRI